MAFKALTLRWGSEALGSRGVPCSQIIRPVRTHTTVIQYTAGRETTLWPNT